MNLSSVSPLPTGQTGMHAVLRTAELRALIFEELPRRSLAALARSCKELSQSALAVLWYELRNLQPVYRLLTESKG